MRTDFTPEQLRNPRLAEAQDILHDCVHCGLCNATCPTYVVSGDERESPRGRIYLIKSMLERGLSPTGAEIRHIDSCLGCLSCTTTCPYDVDYLRLLDLAREEVDQSKARGVIDQNMRRLFLEVMPHPVRLRSLLRYARMAKPLGAFVKGLGMKSISAVLDSAPAGLLPSASYEGPGLAATKTTRRYRVAMLAGCTQQVLRPEINDATIRLLARRGVDVEVASGAGCCGAYAKTLGAHETAVEQAKVNIEAWMKLIGKGELDAIIIAGAGCGTAVKDYERLLKYEPDYDWKAKQIAGLAKDITEFLDGFDLGPPKRWSSLRVAYHSSCAMQHGQGIDKVPRDLLVKAGFAVVDVPEAHLCCGGAGGYQMLHPDLAGTLRERKAENIAKSKPDLVACGDMNCIAQLAMGMETPIVHTVELLDWAYGGPVPRGLEKLAELVSNVPEVELPREKPRLPIPGIKRPGSPGGAAGLDAGPQAGGHAGGHAAKPVGDKPAGSKPDAGGPPAAKPDSRKPGLAGRLEAAAKALGPGKDRRSPKPPARPEEARNSKVSKKSTTSKKSVEPT